MISYHNIFQQPQEKPNGLRQYGFLNYSSPLSVHCWSKFLKLSIIMTNGQPMKKTFIRYFEEGFNDGSTDSPAYKTVNGIIVVLILISTLEVILSSEPSFQIFDDYLYVLFIITSFLFLIEYLLRIYIKKKTDANFRGFSAYRNYFFDFYNLLDFIAIIPFFISFFGLHISPIWKTLRVLRIFKILRYIPSVELLVNGLKNKKSILLISIQSIFFLALLLSIALYYWEHKSAQSEFTSISQALIWSLAKFIGDIGGYGDFAPVTFVGKVIATLNGVLGIAIFALPAGIIGSGFVEEIEKREKEKQALEHINLVKNVFERDHLSALTRIKRQYEMEFIRRKSLTYNDLKYRLNLTEDDIAGIVDRSSGLRVRTVNTILHDGSKVERIVAEYYESNRIYGTFVNKISPLCIISPLSNDQPYIGHFTYALSEGLGANYLSVEKFSKSDFNPQRVLDFMENRAYFHEENLVAAVQVFKEDLKAVSRTTKTFIIIGAKASKGYTYELLNGGKAGDKTLLVNESSFHPVETLTAFSTGMNNKLAADGLSLGIHEDYGITGDYHLMHYLNKKLKTNVIQINVSANLLKEEKELYYKSIYNLSEMIKEHFL